MGRRVVPTSWNTRPYLHYSPSNLLALQVLAVRYWDCPSAFLEEQMLRLTEAAMVGYCWRLKGRWYGFEVEDLLQVARLASTKALRTYNPKNGDFSSWQSTCLWTDCGNFKRSVPGLIKMSREQRKRNVPILSLDAMLGQHSKWETCSAAFWEARGDRREALKLFSPIF